MVKNCRLSLLLAVLSIVLVAGARVSAAPAWPSLSPEDARQIMPVSQLKRGMRGYGLTVFHGTKIEKFDVEILGVLKQMNLGKDLILVRIGGGPVTTRQTGIIAGMSGSPVYINGKLVGAVAYGSQFAKEPVGMLTPIADMLETWDENLPRQASGYSSPRPVTVDGKSVTKVSVDYFGEKTEGVDDGILYMQPLMTPLMVSGISQRGMAQLADILKPFNIRPMAGPGGGEKKGVDAQLVPGAAVGMSLASGDIDMTGVGTLTYRRGNRILAFGHPMLSIGAVDAPMTTAFVDDVLSSYRVSTKMASPIKTVGRIFQDRPWAIAGQMGTMAKTIPVVVQVEDQAYKRSRTYRVNVINHPLIASRLVRMVVNEAVFQMHSAPGDATAEVTYTVMADQVGKITRTNVFFDSTAVDMVATSDIGTLLQMLSTNRFHPLDVKSVDVKVKIADQRNTATIDRIFVKESEYEPGETVDVGVVLRPYKKDRITKTFKIKIPATAADGKIVLQVRGGAMPAMMPIGLATGSDGALGGDDNSSVQLPGGDSGMANADNVKQLIDKYLEREKNNQIVIQLQMRGTAINVSGEKMTGLPSAIADVMKSSRNSGLKMDKDEVKQVYDDDMIITGSARLTIDVKKKDVNESKGSSKSRPAVSVDERSGSETALVGDGGLVMTGGARAAALAPMAAVASVVVSEEPAGEGQGPDESQEPAATVSTSGADSSKPDATGGGTASAPKTNVKTVVRQVKTWSQNTQADFAKGTFSGISTSSEDKLELAPTLKKLVDTPEQFVWSLAPVKDGVFAGTGDLGRIYHITDSGEAKVFYETGELEVHSLARDVAGNIYAGTSPYGRIFKVTPDGKGQLLYKAEGKYILALALDPEGNLYAGEGDSGRIYRITPGGDTEVFANINEQQILSLNWDVHGSLVVGTGINGVVYRVDKYGKAEPIFDAEESSVTSVVTDGNGYVYAGTSPKGVIYKIAPDGRAKAVYSKATRVLGMTSDAHNNIYAVSDGSLVRIAPDETVVVLDSAQDKVQFLSLAFNEFTGALYASTGNVGSVFVSKCCEIRGTFESAVHDTKMVSKWGRIKWVADTPEGTGVEIRTRTGNVETPDGTWSGWSAPYTRSSGEGIASDPARYAQYQVTMTTSKPEITPRVSLVTLSYLTPNQPPTVKLSAPAGGQVWAGKQTIKWVGSDPDKDTLTYDVFYSGDGGKEWKALVGGMTGGGEKKPDTGQIVDKVKKELEKAKDVSEGLSLDLLKEEDKSPGAKSGTNSAASSAKPSTSTSYSWDTKKVPDGTYVIKVVASDKTSNASDALTKDVISEPFVVCNTPPDIKVYKGAIELKATGSATITGSASSKLTEVVGVQFRIDGGNWMAAASDSGMFDSLFEAFTITTGPLETGTHKVEVQAVDAAGNAANQTVEVKVT